MMPSAVPKNIRTDEEWKALKAYIIRDRKRIKQEQEADAEVQRQRREREQKQKQDVMTLGETREQIQELQARLQALTEEKHQLFLTLKKVLNEDDNRRRQSNKESSEPHMMGGYIPPQMFLQPLQGRGSVIPSGSQVYKTNNSTEASMRLATISGGSQSHGALGASGQQVQTLKRPRSPSSPPTAGPSGYQHTYNNFKPASSSSSYQPPASKPDEHVRGRGNEYVRAVLWNKGATSSYGNVYGVTPSQAVYSYATAPSTYEPVYMPRQSYESKQQQQQQQQQTENDKVYLRGGPSGTLSIPLHPSQATKPGGISSGFPVRTPIQTAHGAYLTARANGASRLLYGTSPTPTASSPQNKFPRS